ncbi:MULTISPECIES: TetR/AcrR family transcriptional regulator [Streptomyces]|uniref:TetR family transcriptional regulator n=1 Tax=Streptomyces dengpaensis TaxID=2049881 RepID=A0ABM6SQG6_9ACTN|nr:MULTISPECIES: TetR family transcriptional regulator [Streptomyces]AVH56816.1 TetR family transcriptional regulator [Streptomyces dengpaensis]PIB10154.1 TetR family transcriptional regulator [Streptomyces sp. HG99]
MTAHRASAAPGSPPGLRERKKMKTRIAIRDATYRLIQEQGYEAATIERIAEAAEVSPSTVFRYFPAKEDIVLTDEYDPVLEEELRARPADEPWFDSLRYVVTKAIGLGLAEEPEVTRLRTRLMVEVPAVRSRMMESMSVTGRLLCRAIGERTGRDPQSLEVRVFAMSLMGGLMETSLYWAEGGHQEDYTDVVDRAVSVLEHGLTPGNPEAAGTPRMTS